MSETRCGFIALIGAPNAGKSTLLNRLVGAKLAIVTPKVQTTRNPIRGIRMQGDTQMIFVDTPGIYQPKERFEKAMVSSAWGGAADADVVALLVDAHKGVTEELRTLLQKLAKIDKPKALVLNKIDLLHKDKLLALTAELYDLLAFDQTYMISALKGQGVDDMVEWLSYQLPTGPHLFPDDQLSDLPQRLLAAETTREKLFLRLQKELPYALMVETEGWEEKADGSVKISQIVYVQRESHKKIVLGHNGQQLKEIGQSARHDLTRQLERTVHLFLFVKVKADWKDRREFYTQIGLEY